MGAGASTGAGSAEYDDVDKWSKEHVGEQVAAIGTAFERYKEIAIANDVDGETLLDIADEDLQACGVDNAMHRKKILKKVKGLKANAESAPSFTTTPDEGERIDAAPQSPASAGLRRFSRTSNRAKLFMSYPRGEETTPFARWLKGKLEAEGYAVWMDEEGIRSGADFMQAIGEGIMSSDALVAVIDEKFCGSTYCNNELAMAQGNGCKLLPCLFRSMTFGAMPAGLQYMLASINCIAFPDPASDAAVLARVSTCAR